MKWIKRLISKKLLNKAVNLMFDSLKGKLDGKKTYITVGVGLLVAAVGVLFGPVDLGVVQIPAVTPNEFFKYLWEGLIGTFIRAGVAAK